jgi:cobalt-zinc-cadmium efflux system outer membrane protein
MQPWKWGAVMTVAAWSFTFPALAEESACSSRVNRTNLVPCAMAASLAVRVERHEMDAAEGRRGAVSPLLPSNPVLNAAVARRSIPGGPVVSNWDVSLSQEFEIAGQRGLRVDAARAEVHAQEKRIVLVQRDVAAAAWIAFFDVLAAAEEQRLAAGLAATSQAVAIAARARAEKGLIAPVDSDVADATWLRWSQAKLAADRRAFAARASLATLLGTNPALATVVVEGELVPLSGVETAARMMVTSAPGRNPEVQALDAERRSMELRADAFRRSRIPNPALSVFVQNDGFNERVLGLGLALPIPVPGLGRTFNGEIVESEALGRRAAVQRELVAREVQREAAVALQAYETRKAEIAILPPEKIARAEQSLRAFAQEIEAGRLTVRDAVVAQQALIELLSAGVAARRALCIASVDLAKALGVSLEGGTQ